MLSDGRLPASVVPVRYDLTLTVEPEAGEAVLELGRRYGDLRQARCAQDVDYHLAHFSTASPALTKPVDLQELQGLLADLGSREPESSEG